MSGGFIFFLQIGTPRRRRGRRRRRRGFYLFLPVFPPVAVGGVGALAAGGARGAAEEG